VSSGYTLISTSIYQVRKTKFFLGEEKAKLEKNNNCLAILRKLLKGEKIEPRVDNEFS
jgi:hypothetical protein